MSREQYFALYRSVYEPSKRLSKRGGAAFLQACAAFYFEGIEPTGLGKDASLLFEGVLPRLRAARNVMLGTRNDVSNDGAERVQSA